MIYFALGKNPALSLAEIKSVFTGSEVIIGKGVVLIDDNFDMEKSVAQLGGVIKGGKIVGNLKNSGKDDINGWVMEYVSRLLRDNKLIKEKKFLFGFSVYSDREKFDDKKFIKRMAMEFKKRLKEEGVSSRWVVSKEGNLSSVIVGENKLFVKENGLELNIIDIDGNIYIGETEATQDYKMYSNLDYGRPLRDARSGMLPVKLAKIMMNLAGARKDMTILDPFCGSGTVLQEALSMGYKNVIGSDFSKQAIENSQKNIEWLKENYPEITEGKDLSLMNVSVEKIAGAIKKGAIDVIVTKPHLGPPIRKGVPFDMQLVVKNLSKLYLKSFRQFKEVLKENGTVVMVWPIFKAEDGFYKFMPIIREIEEMGFKKSDVLPTELLDFARKKYGGNIISKRNTIIYSRADQYIKRELVRFIKV